MLPSTDKHTIRSWVFCLVAVVCATPALAEEMESARVETAHIALEGEGPRAPVDDSVSGTANKKSTSRTLALKYEAFMAGTPVGSARVLIDETTQGYSVTGRARSGGLLEAFNPWRATFRMLGRWQDGRRKLREYFYKESDKRKSRVVSVSDGRISVIKNGKQRPERDALPGLDVLSALFVEPRCDADIQLHTGRHGYHLQVRGLGAGDDQSKCRYRVTDDDGDKYDLAIEFVEIDDRLVPEALTVRGVVSGRLELAKHEVRESGG